jgi:hypothetical protein
MFQDHKFNHRLIYKKFEEDGDWLLEAVNEPAQVSTWKWNMPYYSYLYRIGDTVAYLVTMKEVRASLFQGDHDSFEDIHGSLLELYEGESFEELEAGTLQKAYFKDTYEYLKKLREPD